MIIGFSSQFPDGRPTNFRKKILAGIKQSTIRVDRNDRFKLGTKLHFSTGVRTKNYECFAEGIVETISPIEIDPTRREIILLSSSPFSTKSMVINSESDYMRLLLSSEGFESKAQFWKWFDKPMGGKLISWRFLNG